MGGGRDFTGHRIYIVKTTDGKRIYTRTRPYKRELLSAIKNAANVNELSIGLQNLGLTEKQIKFVSQVKDFETAKSLSLGLSDMVAKYGSEMFDSMELNSNDDMHEGEYANSSLRSPYRINLNTYYFSGKQERYYENDIATGFHPKGMSDRMLIHHEYAHLLQNMLSEEGQNYYKDRVRDTGRLKEIQSEMKELNESFGGKYYEYQRNTIFSELYGEDSEYGKNAKNLFREMSSQNSEALNKLIRLDNERENINTKSTFDRGNEKIIENIFQKIGYQKLSKVGASLTGNRAAYASKNWSEAHAECVADAMMNGRNASQISKAYMKEIDKLLGVRR